MRPGRAGKKNIVSQKKPVFAYQVYAGVGFFVAWFLFQKGDWHKKNQALLKVAKIGTRALP